MSNIKPIIDNLIIRPLAKQDPQLTKITSNIEENIVDTSKSIQAENLPALGIKIKKTTPVISKIQLDAEAETYISKLFQNLENLSPQSATEHLLKLLTDENFEFVKHLSIDIRKYGDRTNFIKKIIGEQNFNTKFIQEFKNQYAKYLDEIWSNDPQKGKSLDELLELRPDWSFEKIRTKMDFTKPRAFGEIPDDFISEDLSSILFKHLDDLAGKPKDSRIKIPDLNINGTIYKITRFTDGANKAGVFKVSNGDKEFVIKINNAPNIDPEFWQEHNIEAFPSRDIFLDYFLTKNNCTDVPKLYYYKFDPNNKKNIAIYEYIKPDEGSKFNQSVKLPDMKSLNVNFIDTMGENNIIFRNGKPYCVDNDDSTISMPLDLFRMGYFFTKMPPLSMPY